MSININDIKDPKTRARVQQALDAASGLKRDLAVLCQGPVKFKKRIRQSSKPLMNKLEQEYYDTFHFNDEPNVCVQAVSFKLARGLWYTPDFFAPGDSPVGIEVKGPHAFRGGFENLKMAAHQYPWIKWVLTWKDNGVWQEQVVLP